ncbi:MAG: ATP-dependent DNA helicase, partial [Bacteroidota bacterium]
MTYFENNPQLELAYKFLHYTNQNIFLTGKAGTGKTTFLKNLRKISPKRMVVVAPTGVAAINAGGVTIHSFFQLPFGPQLPQSARQENGINSIAGKGNGEYMSRFSRNKINLIRSLDLLVIDEISMVRADVLDAIDATLRRFKNRFQPFGGLQLLMIGDLQQLAPVVKEDEWEILKDHYQTCFFFSSQALKKSDFIGIELKHIYRQSEQAFIDLLNKVRDNNLDYNDLQLLNSRFIHRFSPGDEQGYITLTTHNYQAKQINESRLQKLNTKLFRFQCIVEGEFPAISYPADEVLEIKTGAQVMFLKNDLSPEKRYYNGKLGKVVNILDDQISVLCPGDTEPIIVEPDYWENTKYRLNESTAEIEEEVAGKFIQYPLKLAWAITIHKSQGLTFEKAIIDAAQSFAHGQVYVALSRCKNLEGLVLSTPLSQQSVINDTTVAGFINHIEQNQPGYTELEQYRRKYELLLLNELIDFKPVVRSISFIMKLWNENASTFIGNLQDKLRQILIDIQAQMIDVADKFRPQMENLIRQHDNAEENRQLQDRLQKASAYFLSKLEEHLESPLSSVSFDTDNKALRKRLFEMIGLLETEIEIKKSCLESVKKGFTIKDYLTARAVGKIEKPSVKARTQAAAINVTHADFYR